MVATVKGYFAFLPQNRRDEPDHLLMQIIYWGGKGLVM